LTACTAKIFRPFCRSHEYSYVLRFQSG
jgi:hypothetical protein